MKEVRGRTKITTMLDDACWFSKPVKLPRKMKKRLKNKISSFYVNVIDKMRQPLEVKFAELDEPVPQVFCGKMEAHGVTFEFQPPVQESSGVWHQDVKVICPEPLKVLKLEGTTFGVKVTTESLE